MFLVHVFTRWVFPVLWCGYKELNESMESINSFSTYTRRIALYVACICDGSLCRSTNIM